MSKLAYFSPTMTAFLYSSPWRSLGDYKYVLYFPLAALAIASRHLPIANNFCLHILAIAALRAGLHQLFQMYSRFLPLSSKTQIRHEGATYAQVDREWHCDDHLLLQSWLLFAANAGIPFFRHLPLWNGPGLLVTVLLHMGPAECLFYWMHRALHSRRLFDNYHKLHHESVTPEPSTAGTSSFLEKLLLSMIIAVPILGASLLGAGSIVSLYIYLLLFECMRAMGHCNVEMIPRYAFRFVPPLRYLLYTPSYHTLHHELRDSNFCLFMPLYDYLGQTFNHRTVAFHAETSEGRKEPVPDFVFLLHAVSFTSCLHVHFVFRAFASHPYKANVFTFPLLPLVLLIALAMWVWGGVFQGWNYFLRERFHQIWLIPRFGFQYFLPFGRRSINKLIERGILDADRIGVKVLGLAALNKNESLNGGGALFVKKYPNLRVRLCHGNTLTAAVILNQIPSDVSEVFMNGATSKLGRAIALYLCKKGVRVLMLTESRTRFETIASEAPSEFQNNLVQVTKYQAGKNCHTWILGKWIAYSQQRLAPPGTRFHQFVVPPVIPFRRDCTYGKLAAIRLPDDVRGLSSCEYTLDRNVVHACHAGGVVHSLEGWTHHEVGAIDVERIDVVWEAALRQGLRPIT